MSKIVNGDLVIASNVDGNLIICHHIKTDEYVCYLLGRYNRRGVYS